MIWNLGESIEREYIFKEYGKNAFSAIAWWQDTTIPIGERLWAICSHFIWADFCHLAMIDDCKRIKEWFAFLQWTFLCIILLNVLMGQVR